MIMLSAEHESEAFAENIIREEVLQDGTHILSTYNSNKQQTALSYVSQQQIQKGSHA